MDLIKEDNRGKVYQADDFKILYRNKDEVIGDNSENIDELIYFITGSVEITLKNKTWVVDSPTKIDISANTYHKIKALTDISFILFEK